MNDKEPKQTVDGEKKQVKDYFKAKADFCHKLSDSEFDRMYALPMHGEVANARSYHAFASLTFSELAFIYEHFSWLVCRDVEMAYDNLKRMRILEEMINEVGEKSGADLSKLNSELESIKTNVNSEEIAKVAKFAVDFNNHIEESKKRVEEYKRKMEENDLAE